MSDKAHLVVHLIVGFDGLFVLTEFSTTKITTFSETNFIRDNGIVISHLRALHALIVYQMGTVCGGAHEISGIKAPIFLSGWVGGGGVGGVGGGGVGTSGGVVGGVIRLSF